MSAREGAAGGQPFDPAIEAALQEAQAARITRIAYEADPERRSLTIRGEPERLPTDIIPPEPVAIQLPWFHLKAIMAGILVHEAGEHERDGQAATADLKRRIAQKLEQEGAQEARRALTAKQRAEAARERAEREQHGQRPPPISGLDI